MMQIPINLLVEDDLSEAIVRRILDEVQTTYAVGNAYGKTGFGYLKKNIKAFNKVAQGTPYIALTDLDSVPCPSAIRSQWFGKTSVHPNLLFQIAVREVEAWLLADQNAFAKFIGIRESLIPNDVEQISDPKEFLFGLVAKCRRKSLIQDMIPPKRSTSKTGPGYNTRLEEYVREYWRPREALKSSKSLTRFVNLLDEFEPTWPKTA